MRKTKEVTEIPSKRITVKELTVKEIRTFWNVTGEKAQEGIESLADYLQTFLPTCVDGITATDFEEMTPSEIKLIYDAFMEVNEVFFDLAQTVEGENPVLIDLRISLWADLIVRYAGLSRKVTPPSSTTDTPSSST